MSLAALFGFGSVIFLIVMTGAFVYGMTALRYAPISHERWPLQRAKIISLDDSLVQAAGFDSPRVDINGEPNVMFSRGVQVRVGLPRRA